MRLLGSARIVDAMLFVWAAALPTHPFPGSPIRAVGAGEWLAPVALAVTVAAVALVPPGDRRPTLPSLAPVAALLVGFAPSVAFAIDVRAAAMQLAVLAWVGTIFAIGYAVTALQARRGLALSAGLLAGVLVRAVWGWLQPLDDPWLASGWPRPLGWAESPNMIALQASVGAIAALLLRRATDSARRRAALLGATVLLVVTTIATLGHVFIASLVAVAFLLRRTLRGSRARLIAGTAVFLSVALLVASARTRLVPLHASPPFLDLRPDLYAAAHEVALETFLERPLTGVGLENFRYAWRAHDDGMRFAGYVPEGRNYTPGTPIDPHSTWLGYLAEGGLAGGATLAVLVLLALRVARRRDDRLLDLALAFAGASAVIADVLTSRELALVLGVLAALPHGARQRPGTSSLRHRISAHPPPPLDSHALRNTCEERPTEGACGGSKQRML